MAKKALIHARTGLQTLHQGKGVTAKGSAALAGNTRKILAQGSTPTHAAPTGKLGSIMKQ